MFLVDQIGRDRCGTLTVELEDIDHGLDLFIGHSVDLSVRAAGSRCQICLCGLFEIYCRIHRILQGRSDRHDTVVGQDDGTGASGVVYDIDTHIDGTRIGIRGDRDVAAACVRHTGEADSEFIHARDQGQCSRIRLMRMDDTVDIRSVFEDVEDSRCIPVGIRIARFPQVRETSSYLSSSMPYSMICRFCSENILFLLNDSYDFFGTFDEIVRMI